MAPLKWHLVLLVVGSLLPVALFAIFVVHKLSAEARTASEHRMLLAARDLSQDVEREVSTTARTLQSLAASEQLDKGNLKAFHAEVRRAAMTQPTWLTVILLTPNGHQVVNTSRPFGVPLPKVNEPESLQHVVETRQTTLGYLARGRLGESWAFPVRVPVMRGGELRYVLTAVITPEALASVIKTQTPTDGEWTRTVVDGRGVVVARTRAPERFVGQRGTKSFLQRIAQTTEGVYRETTLDKVQVYVAFSQISFSGWKTAVAVPVEVLESPARRAMYLVVGSGIVLFLVSGVGAVILSQWISHSIASAALAAEALAKGEYISISPSSIKEVALLDKSLKFSAELLSQRERERNENLAQVEAAREAAEEASRLKDEFLITVSHELRTPLNAILGWSQLLSSKQLKEDKIQHGLKTIERNAKAQAQLVDDLLDTSRIITGKLRLKPQLLNPDAVLTSVVDSVRHTAETKGINLELQLATDTKPIIADENRIGQVISNLLSNAIKFTPQGGQIKVDLRQVSEQVEIVVSDTGVGIKADFLPHVFDRFRQADGSTTREFGGLGLGLAIVRHLVELHGGTVQVSSDGEGKGAAFTIRLPLATNQEKTNPLLTKSIDRKSSPQKNHSLTGARVLVVDDELDARDLLKTVLTQCGAEVRAYSSTTEALTEVTTWKPSVILSDISMPQGDGYDFIRKVREWEIRAGVKIPAAAVTAFTRDEDRVKAITSGYQMHIPKPIEPTELVAAVSSLVCNF
ncbi:hypothetical protein NIES2101_24360 [Calothrix sp. HK-06]|nr:hypothetical protein NIES2101_24360 [Calothrix sp. HK-06]